MQEFLASFAVKIDEAGVSRLQSVLSENRELAEQLAEAFDGASAAIRSFSEELGMLSGFSGFDVPAEENAGPGRLTVGLDLAQAFSDYEAFTALVKQPVSLKANATGIVSVARSAMSSIRSIFSDPVEVKLKANSEFYDRRDQSSDRNFDGCNMATVFRNLNRRDCPPGSSLVSVALSSDEISATGSPQSFAQIKDLDSCSTIQNAELTPAGGEKTKGSQIEPADWGSQPAVRAGAILSETLRAGEAGAGSVSHYSQNVSAPVNIHVTAAGSDPEQIGRSLYDTAERYLLRTLRSARG